ncbi:DUF4395 domain-containing protein [Salinithrix halophila]|uniref:DUF4395 domain-containing protein n=1 Tax=Salinithrix halophila TaxID=1485204 RepID=A0ABV8JIN0_9BACL
MKNGIPLPLVRMNQWFQVIAVLLALSLKQYWLLSIPLAFGLWSLFFRQNPLFLLARPLLRKPISQYPMEDPDQQRFNQMIAVICLALSLLGFALGWRIFGYTFAILVATAALIAILGFCVGCFLRYRYLQWKYQRNRAG